MELQLDRIAKHSGTVLTLPQHLPVQPPLFVSRQVGWSRYWRIVKHASAVPYPNICHSTLRCLYTLKLGETATSSDPEALWCNVLPQHLPLHLPPPHRPQHLPTLHPTSTSAANPIAIGPPNLPPPIHLNIYPLSIQPLPLFQHLPYLPFRPAGWIEPLLDRIVKHPGAVPYPNIEIIFDNTFRVGVTNAGSRAIFRWKDLTFQWEFLPDYERTRRKSKADYIRSVT